MPDKTIQERFDILFEEASEISEMTYSEDGWREWRSLDEREVVETQTKILLAGMRLICESLENLKKPTTRKDKKN